MSKIGVIDLPSPNSSENKSIKTLDLTEQGSNFKKKVPKRVLHFSDGVLEEYSSDEEQSDSSTFSSPPGQLLQANVAHLAWMPWLWYHSTFIGSKALAACDYLGESLANFFGILSPKYEYEIEQYKKAIAEELAREKEDAELGSFSQRAEDPSPHPIQSEPHSQL